jgi:LemA protein
MQNKNMKWIIVIAIVVIIAMWGIGRYNAFISQNEAITGQWAQVDAQLQRRFDLIPNIVSTVKGVAKQEQTVFGEIADARTRYAGAQTRGVLGAPATKLVA